MSGPPCCWSYNQHPSRQVPVRPFDDPGAPVVTWRRSLIRFFLLACGRSLAPSWAAGYNSLRCCFKLEPGGSSPSPLP
jgi:hypothetical protein